MSDSEQSFPAPVSMPQGPGPLTITNVHAGSVMRFEVDDDGLTEASTRDRLAALLRAGGTQTPRPTGRENTAVDDGDPKPTPKTGADPTPED